MAQRARHHGGRHALAAALPHQAFIVNGGVRVLDQPRQQAQQRSVFRSLGKLPADDLDGFGRGHLAQVHAAYTVGQREQPAPRPPLLAGLGNKKAGRVLIVGADLPRVRRLPEFHIQHLTALATACTKTIGAFPRNAPAEEMNDSV
jgi:hypothetical protein